MTSSSETNNRCGKNIYGFFMIFVLFVLENIFLVVYMYGIRKSAELNTKAVQATESPARVVQKTSINSTWLENNPVYRKYYVEGTREKKVVNILIIVTSAPKRIDRRNAIRSTWWTQCVETANVSPACVFITDYQGPNDEFFHSVREEQKQYKDLHFQLVRGGVTFGNRFINHMLFAVHNYVFDYLIRMDDDVFFCFDKVLNELPMPRLPSFHWGWVHRIGGITRPEEFLILLSRDVVETFLSQDPNTMLCHPLADQMIATWITVLQYKTLLRHDDRIHHDPPVRNMPDILGKKDICNSYLALHGAYPESMRHLWAQRGNFTVKGNLSTNSQSVPTNQPFNWRIFGNKWRYEPKLCIQNPTWDTSLLLKAGSSYVGREGS